MVNGFRRQQVTAKDAFHHDNVFEDVVAFAGPRVSGRPAPAAFDARFSTIKK
jgi:hypothetical protein